MRLHNRGSDSVEERGAPAAPQGLRHRLILRRRVLARHELIDERIADVARSRPSPIRRGGRALEVGDRAGVSRMRPDRSEGVGMIRRAALTRSIDEINAIALLHVVMRPSSRAVARSHVMQHLSASAVDEDDRIWMSYLCGNQVLHV